MLENSLVLCVGTTTDLSAQVVRSAGQHTLVLVVPDTENAIRVLQNAWSAPAAQFGPLRLDDERRQAYWSDQQIELSARQFDLLATLASSGDRVWTYRELTTAVWHRTYIGDTDAVTSAVKRLRRRLAVVTSDLLIRSVRGIGYRLVIRQPRPAE